MTWLNVSIACLGVGMSAAGLFALLRVRARRAMAWSLLLVLGGPAAAVLVMLLGARPEARPEPVAIPYLLLHEATNARAVTDKGRPIQLLCATAPDREGEFVGKQCSLLQQCDLIDHVALLSGRWRNCNCHGWVFADGCFFIDDHEVVAILEDNAYRAVASPRPADLAVYRDNNNLIVHSGIVRSTEGRVMVESKWGWGGVFLHPEELTPYSPAACTFYRAKRPNHLLQGVRESTPIKAE